MCSYVKTIVLRALSAASLTCWGRRAVTSPNMFHYSVVYGLMLHRGMLLAPAFD